MPMAGSMGDSIGGSECFRRRQASIRMQSSRAEPPTAAAMNVISFVLVADGEADATTGAAVVAI